MKCIVCKHNCGCVPELPIVCLEVDCADTYDWLIKGHVNEIDQLCQTCWNEARLWLQKKYKDRFASTVLTPVEMDDWLENTKTK